MLNDDLLRGDSMGEKTKEKQEVRISEKLLLSINEANALSGIGQNKLRELTLDPRCPFVLFVGRKRLIKRKAFEAFIDKELEIQLPGSLWTKKSEYGTIQCPVLSFSLDKRKI